MTDLCTAADTSDSGSVLIKASRSDLSFANSSPRLESNATTSTACINDVQPLRRDLSSELLCPLCDQLFDRPVMVTCGHSYCEPCIERHTRETRNCVICKHDVGPLEAMIPSITLDNMVRKLKNAENIETSFDDLFICEEKLPKETVPPPPSIGKTLSSKRRLFFSIAAPTICSSPITPHRRRPLSPSARPIKSALKFPPESLNTSFPLKSPQSEDGEHSEILTGSALFRRNGFGRRSERFTSATQANPNSFDEEEKMECDSNVARPRKDKSEDCEGKLKRNSFFRRSLNVIRSKTNPRRSFGNSFVNSKIPEEEESEEMESLINSAVINGEKEESNEKKKNVKSLWRRLFLSKKDKITDKKPASSVRLLRHESLKESSTTPTTTTTTIAFIRLENQHDDPEHPNDLINSNLALGYYMGIGRKFERIASGSEITLVVFGHANAGKTTFVRGIRQLFLEGTERIRIIPIAERYRLAGIGMMPFPEGDNRLPHIVSLVINKPENDGEFVLDIIDPEYDNSNLPQAYMDACDAAFLLIDGRNCASLLSAHQIQRNMKNAQHSHIQCEMLMNVPSDPTCRMLNSNACEAMVKKMAVRELCVNKLEKSVVEQMLLQICDRVHSARQLPTEEAEPTE